MRAAIAGLAALAASLLIAAPAGAATRAGAQAAAFSVSTPTSPIRDLVIARPSRMAAGATTFATTGRYPVNDGQGRTVEITVTTQCQASPVTCDAANPPQIASALGRLPHHDEMNLLRVTLVDPLEVAVECFSPDAQACYFPGENRMVINGSDDPAPDGASRDFVVAHEYGHHLANHRDNPPFDVPALDWGPKGWASFARVCEGVRGGRYFPGRTDGNYYFLNPGEAFAESFAHNAFPSDPVPWHWPSFPDPSTGAYPAIQRDALDPWDGATVDKRRGLFGKQRPKRKKQRKTFPTPNDGDLTLSLRGPDRADLVLTLRGPTGAVLERSDGVGSTEEVSYQVCGERFFTAVVRRRGSKKTRFALTGLVP